MANAFDSRSAEEGRSAFAKQGGGTRVGEKIVDERVTMISDPADSELLGSPFDNEGMPLGRQVWGENGVLKNLYSSRFWAQKQGRAPTGNASSLKMLGGDQSLEQLIATTERGEGDSDARKREQREEGPERNTELGPRDDDEHGMHGKASCRRAGPAGAFRVSMAGHVARGVRRSRARGGGCGRWRPT